MWEGQYSIFTSWSFHQINKVTLKRGEGKLGKSGNMAALHWVPKEEMF